MLLFHTMYHGIGKSFFCGYATYIFTPALVSKGHIARRHICPVLKLAVYRYHIAISIIATQSGMLMDAKYATDINDLELKNAFSQKAHSVWFELQLLHWSLVPVELIPFLILLKFSYCTNHTSYGNYKLKLCMCAKDKLWAHVQNHSLKFSQ